jgi:hypothetical protein
VKVKVDNSPGFGGVGFFMYNEPDYSGKIRVVKKFKLETEEIDQHDVISPSFVLDHRDAEEFLQEVTNEAAKRGIFPKDFKQQKDNLEATQYHLEDMRKLVFKGV